MISVDDIKTKYIVVEAPTRHLILDKETEEYLCYFKVLKKGRIFINNNYLARDLQDIEDIIDHIHNYKFSNPLVDKYIVVNGLKLTDFVRDSTRTAVLHETLSDACTMCGMIELDGALVLKIEYVHKEEE